LRTSVFPDGEEPSWGLDILEKQPLRLVEGFDQAWKVIDDA
jgi:hypothetical protein